MHSRIALRSVCAAFALALASLLAPSSAANPAALAATSYVVNDNLGDCDANGATHATIQSAVDAALANNIKTILVCPGSYSDFDVTGANKLTIKAALPGTFPTVDAPAISGGVIVDVQNSSGVVLDGLKIDGGNFDDALTGSTFGISFHNSSGTVQNSSVTRLRCYPNMCTDGIGIALLDDNGDGKASTLSVKRVNITDIGYAGILVSGPAKLTASGARITGNFSGGMGTTFVGVWFNGYNGATGSVTKSTIYGVQHGVNLDGASKVTLSGNTIGNADNGVTMDAVCITGNDSASSNKIAGNTFLNLSQYGVYISNVDTTGCVHTDKNTISGNTISGSSGAGAGVSFITGAGSLAEKNKISGNMILGFNNGILIGGASVASVSGNTRIP